jgi:hypothetical protein
MKLVQNRLSIVRRNYSNVSCNLKFKSSHRKTGFHPYSWKVNSKVSNLTERKICQQWCQGFVCLSIRDFDRNYLRICWTEWAVSFFRQLYKRKCFWYVGAFEGPLGAQNNRNSNFPWKGFTMKIFLMKFCKKIQNVLFRKLILCD